MDSKKEKHSEMYYKLENTVKSWPEWKKEIYDLYYASKHSKKYSKKYSQ